MSTDLQFCQDLLQIRLPAVKTSPPKQSSVAAATIQPKLETTSTLVNDNDNDEEECSTPTSAEHKIPTVFSCPPAPKRQRFEPACSCKRKLGSEFQFYEIVAREEIEVFFRSGFEAVNRNSKRRRPFL